VCPLRCTDARIASRSVAASFLPPYWAAISTFSMTLSDRNGFGNWNVRLTPSRASLYDTTPPMDRPSNVKVPPSGVCSPVMTLIQVGCPEPLGPTRPSTSPRRTSKLTPSSARKPPKVLLSLSTESRGTLCVIVSMFPYWALSASSENRHQAVRKKQDQYDN